MMSQSGVADLREDHDWIRVARREQRPVDRLIAHYDLERSLATQLKEAPRSERTRLYGELYDRLFAELPDHPQWTITPERRAAQAAATCASLDSLLSPTTDVAEIGCGDAVACVAMAPRVRSVTGIDVTDRLVAGERPANFRLLLSDGVNLPLPDASVDLVVSNHLVEHLHRDDAQDQLREVHRVLRPGGRYACLTPNRLMGPNDISVFFGYEPQGFHMQEFDHRALAALLASAGFTDLRARGVLKGRRYDVPVKVAGLFEAALEALPRPGRMALFRRFGFLYRMSDVAVVGRK